MKNNIHLLPSAKVVLNAQEPVQGTFQMCRKSGLGMMNIETPEGSITIRLDWPVNVGKAILDAIAVETGPIPA